MDQQRQRRHGRRAAAGRSGGEFELLHHGNQLAYRYVSPAPRRHQPGGHYSWEDTPSSDGYRDFDARSMRTQSGHDSTPKISPLLAACENIHESPSNTFNTILSEPIAQNPTPSTARYDGYVESVYSEGSNEESFHEEHGSITLDHDAPQEILIDGTTGKV